MFKKAEEYKEKDDEINEADVKEIDDDDDGEMLSDTEAQEAES